MVAAMRWMSVASMPSPIMSDMVEPQPSGAFAWAQAVGGAGLVCRPLLGFAPHLFTTRAWALGSTGPAADLAWAPVAAAVGVDSSRLLRLRQVHGSAVVVHRAGEPLPD